MKNMSQSTLFEKKNGVYVSPSAFNKFKGFEDTYVSARSSERRILSIEEIKKLPEVPKDSPHVKEWDIRKKNINRFLNHLSSKGSKLRILDIGCGNGFFTNLMSPGNSLVGVDVNFTELKQAAEAFPNEHIRWYFADILEEELPETKFDVITFCASFQYFENVSSLISRCLNLLDDGGEIHIIDSPFYTNKNVVHAKQNSINYYHKIGCASMVPYYKHHTFDDLKTFSYTLKYNPHSLFRKLFRFTDSPFAWIMIKK